MNPLEQGSRTFSTVVPRLKKELFLIVVVLLYVIALALDPARAVRAATLGGKVFLTVIPVMAAAFGALGLFQVLIKKERIARSLGSQSGFRGLLAASAFGSVLVGPVYIIFPLLRMMREHGARWAIITAVLTSWAVKLPMIPLEIQFLGWRFAALRSALVIVASVCLGLLVELLMSKGHQKTDLHPEVDGGGEGAETQSRAIAALNRVDPRKGLRDRAQAPRTSADGTLDFQRRVAEREPLRQHRFHPTHHRREIRDAFVGYFQMCRQGELVRRDGPGVQRVHVGMLLSQSPKAPD